MSAAEPVPDAAAEPVPDAVSEPVPDAAASDTPAAKLPMSNRVQLRLVLLLSATALIIIALFAYAMAGFQWAIAPMALGLLSFSIALGTMSRRSLSLFWSDLLIMFSGSLPTATIPNVAAPEGRAQSAPSSISNPVYSSVSAAHVSPSVSAARSTPIDTVVESERRVEAAPVVPLSILGMSERRVGSVVLIAGLLAAALSLYLFPDGPPYTLAWWSYGLSAALTLGAVPAFEGGWAALFARFRRGYRVSFEPRALLPWAALGAILVFALLIRLYNLDGFPPGLWYDEADNIDQARLIAENPGQTPMYVSSNHMPSLFLLPIALIIKFAGISITTGRLVAVAFGVAGVLAVFLMVRHMSGTAIGLVAAFLTAVMRWDIIWSRIGLHGITAPFFAALIAWLTYRALDRGRPIDFAVAGATLGLGMWFYSAFRLFAFVIAFVLLHALFFGRQERRRLLVNIGVMAFFSIIVILPVAQFAATNPDEFFKRTRITSIFAHVDEGDESRALLENLGKHLRMFHIEGDPNGRHNIPREPMLDFVSGLLMLAGLVIAAVNWRRAAFIALPVWILVMIMPGVLTIPWEAPQSLRAITVTPAVAALIAIAIGFLWDKGCSVRLPLVRVGTAAFIAVLLAVIAYTNLSAYFGKQASNPEVYAAYSTGETLTARDMAEQVSRGYSPMVSRQLRHSLVASLFGHRFPRQTIAAPLNIPIDPNLLWQGAAVYLEPRETGFYDTLKAYYPSAEFREIRPPMGGDVMYYSAYISREQLEAAQGLVSRRRASDGEVIESVKMSTESAWALEADAEDAPFDVEWRGTLHVTHPGEYTLVLESDSSAKVLLDGMPILSNDNPKARIAPAVGLHALEVHSVAQDADGVLRLLWQPPPRPKEEDEGTSDKESAEQSLEPISASNLYHGDVRPVGLAGRFFKSLQDAAEIGDTAPDAMRVTPGVGGAFWYNSVVEGAHLAVWDGILHAPESGLYRFRFGEVHGEMEVVLDGGTVIDTRADRETELELLEGEHRIRLEYVTSAGSPRFEVLWTPPGQPESRIGPEYLSPAPEYLFLVVDGE